MAQLRQKICITCGAELQLEHDNSYICPACGNHYDMSECAGLIDDLRDAQVSRLSLDFEKAEIYCEKLLDKDEYKNDDDALSSIYWELLLCEQRVIFEGSGVNKQDDEQVDIATNTFPSFYDIVATDIDDSKYGAAVIKHATAAGSSRLATYESLIEKMVMSKRTYRKIKKTTEPFDIFICFKKTAPDKSLTKDCQVATEIYNRLDDDYNVFFSERTLHQLAVGDYEPNIYHALYTAPVMILCCSKREYLTSPWVRNEWNRFIDMSRKTSQVKRIIPVFIDGFSPEDLPDNLRKYQGIKDGRALLSDVSNAVKKIIKPTDKSAEIDAIKAKLSQLAEIQESSNRNASNNQFGDSAIALKKFADRLCSEGQYEIAFNAYKDYLQQNPRDSIILKRFAENVYDNGEYNLARTIYNYYVQRKPDDCIVLNEFADKLYDNEEYDLASNVYSDYVALKPENCMVLKQFADNLCKEREYYLAKKVYNDYIKLKPDEYSVVFSKLINRLYDDKQYEMAKNTAYWYLIKIPKDYSISYIHAKCDSILSNLDSQNLNKFASATQSFIKAVIDDNRDSKEADAKEAINNLANRRRKYFDAEYNNVAQTKIFTTQETIEFNYDYLNKLKNTAEECVKPYYTEIYSQLKDSIKMLDFLMKNRCGLSNVEELANDQMEFIKSNLEYLKRTFTLNTREAYHSKSGEKYFSNRHYNYCLTDVVKDLSYDWDKKVENKMATCKEYIEAVKAFNKCKYVEALDKLRNLNVYDSSELLAKCIELGRDEIIAKAKQFYEEGDFYYAVDYFTIMKDTCPDCVKYLDAIRDKLVEDKYVRAKVLYEEKKYFDSNKILKTLAIAGTYSIPLHGARGNIDVEYSVPIDGYKDSMVMKVECEKVIKKWKKIALIGGGVFLLILIIIIIACSV